MITQLLKKVVDAKFLLADIEINFDPTQLEVEITKDAMPHY